VAGAALTCGCGGGYGGGGGCWPWFNLAPLLRYIFHRRVMLSEWQSAALGIDMRFGNQSGGVGSSVGSGTCAAIRLPYAHSLLCVSYHCYLASESFRNPRCCCFPLLPPKYPACPLRRRTVLAVLPRSTACGSIARTLSICYPPAYHTDSLLRSPLSRLVLECSTWVSCFSVQHAYLTT
jgi:hypothetical protein